MSGITREFWETLHGASPSKFPMTFIVAGQIDFRIAAQDFQWMGCYPIAPEQLDLARQLVRQLEELPFDPAQAVDMDYCFDDECGRVSGSVKISDSFRREVERVLNEIDEGFKFPL